MSSERKKIGEALKERGFITEKHIEHALQEQKITLEKLGEVLVRIGFTTHYDVATVVAEQEGIQYLDVATVVPHSDALRLIKYNECLKHHILPVKVEDNKIYIISANTDIATVRQVVARHCSLDPVIHQGDRSLVLEAIRNYHYFLEHPVEQELEREVELLRQDHSMVRSMDKLLSHLFHLAVKLRATDIHIRPMEKSISVALRIDGVMRPVFALSSSFKRLITSVKILAEMDISEMRLPQDGSFSFKIVDNKYDFRASTISCPYGENVVLRLLDSRSGARGLSELGFGSHGEEQLKNLFKAPHGIILLTGPTGSGKTTTLYAGLRAQDLLSKNVITIEDPIEYRIPMVRQTEVNVKAGYSFANAIRHFLRHDPDVILVGEIRDSETANTSISAAETGHLVLSTIHANDAFGVIPRLHALNVSPLILSDTLLGIVGQRLIRVLCNECKKIHIPTPLDLNYLGLPENSTDTFYEACGCDSCVHTGYVGRVPIYEVLTVNAAIAQAIANKVPINKIREIAQRSGVHTIFDDAVSKVQQGITSIDEVKRMLGLIGKLDKTANIQPDT